MFGFDSGWGLNLRHHSLASDLSDVPLMELTVISKQVFDRHVSESLRQAICQWNGLAAKHIKHKAKKRKIGHSYIVSLAIFDNDALKWVLLLHKWQRVYKIMCAEKTNSCY